MILIEVQHFLKRLGGSFQPALPHAEESQLQIETGLDLLLRKD